MVSLCGVKCKLCQKDTKVDVLQAYMNMNATRDHEHKYNQRSWTQMQPEIMNRATGHWEQGSIAETPRAGQGTSGWDYDLQKTCPIPDHQLEMNTDILGISYGTRYFYLCNFFPVNKTPIAGWRTKKSYNKSSLDSHSRSGIKEILKKKDRSNVNYFRNVDDSVLANPP